MISVEGTKERIHYYLDWIRLLWAGILLNGSGIVGLSLTLDSRVKLAFVVGGAFIEILFGVMILVSHRKVSSLISKLEEES